MRIWDLRNRIKLSQPVFDPLSGWRSSGKADRITVQERSYGYDQKV